MLQKDLLSNVFVFRIPKIQSMKLDLTSQRPFYTKMLKGYFDCFKQLQ